MDAGTIALLDRLKETGFQFSTRSGLSFGASDLKTPPNKEKVIGTAEAAVLQKQRLFERGIITVTTAHGRKATQVGGAPPAVLARQLLSELVREGKA